MKRKWMRINEWDWEGMVRDGIEEGKEGMREWGEKRRGRKRRCKGEEKRKRGGMRRCREKRRGGGDEEV